MLRLYESHTQRLHDAHNGQTVALRERIDELWAALLALPAADAGRAPLQTQIEALEAQVDAQRENADLYAYTQNALPFLNEHHHTRAAFDRRVRDDGEAKDAVEAEWAVFYQDLTNRYVRELHPELAQRDAERRGTAGSQVERVRGAARCPACHSGKFRVYAREGRRVCMACGNTEQHLETKAGYESRAHTSELRQFKYQRLNHLREYLRQLMAVQLRPPPAEVELLVREALAKRMRHLHTDNITPEIVRSMLQQSRQSRYFKHATAIAVRVNPRYRAPMIEPAHYERLMYLFVCTEAPYEASKRDVLQGRKNFMSYPYVCGQLCRLCALDDPAFNAYLPLFPRLKSDELQHQQDRFWARVCAQLGWQFFPTVGNATQSRGVKRAAPPVE